MLQIETFRRDASRYAEGVDCVSNLTHTSKVWAGELVLGNQGLLLTEFRSGRGGPFPDIRGQCPEKG